MQKMLFRYSNAKNFKQKQNIMNHIHLLINNWSMYNKLRIKYLLKIVKFQSK